MTNSGLGTEILVPSAYRYTNSRAGTNYRAGQGDDGNVGIIRSPVRAIALPD
jgi:hypothetical protein